METALFAVGATAAALAAAWVIVQLVTAGRGSFLKERNEELARALEQIRAQRDDDRRECDEQIDRLRADVNRLRGELAAHRVDYARVIAAEVLKALDSSPEWVKKYD